MRTFVGHKRGPPRATSEHINLGVGTAPLPQNDLWQIYAVTRSETLTLLDLSKGSYRTTEDGTTRDVVDSQFVGVQEGF